MTRKMTRRLLAVSVAVATLIAMPAIYFRAESGTEGRQSTMHGARAHAAMSGNGMSARMSGCTGMMAAAMGSGAKRPNQQWQWGT